MNPFVYIFLGKTNEKILHYASQIHPKNTYFHAKIESPQTAESTINQLISQILQNKAGLNLQRVNIFTIGGIADTSHEKIRQNFTANFTIVDTSLIIFDSISPKQTAYDRVFILNSRNEHNEKSPQTTEKTAETAAALPLIHALAPAFCEALSAKSAAENTIPLASAGFWQPPPCETENNLALHKLANHLEKTLSQTENKSPTPIQLLPNCQKLNPTPISHIISLPAKPLNFWHLFNKTIIQAETMLYGDHAQKFFTNNYEPCESPTPPQKTTLSAAAKEQQTLRQTLNEIETHLQNTQQQLSKAENEKCRHSTAKIKEKIAACYALRLKINTLQAQKSTYQTQLTNITDYLDYIKSLIKTIKTLPTTPKTIDTPSKLLAPLSIYLHRNDSLIHEESTNKKSRILRLIGGFNTQDYMI